MRILRPLTCSIVASHMGDTARRRSRSLHRGRVVDVPILVVWLMVWLSAACTTLLRSKRALSRCHDDGSVIGPVVPHEWRAVRRAGADGCGPGARNIPRGSERR